MKAQAVAILAVVFTLTIQGMCRAEGTGEINACYKKANGQLRLLLGDQQCRPSELPIILYGEQSVSCSTAADLLGTRWQLNLNNVSGGDPFPAFQFGTPIMLDITHQQAELFVAMAKLEAYDDPLPFYGAIVDCNEIRMSTGQAVIFATLGEDGETMQGYVFGTDPLETMDGGGWDLTQDYPHMSTFEGEKL